ncbi:MAG: GNAT family N-acetyltransferase [Desulfobacteraceae bacterium]|nr:GNAT family N-acetyltransferase [Desulfobacteraceae bacterium]
MITIRHTIPQDHPRIISVMKKWWDGRDLTSSVPRIFFEHFNNTSYVAQENDLIAGFLIGFFSQSQKTVGYIHFAGAHPDFRRQGLMTRLYERFYKDCGKDGRFIINSCTSPVNKKSIAFHTGIGFKIIDGNGKIDGIPVTLDYNRKDDPKVLFQKNLEDPDF